MNYDFNVLQVPVFEQLVLEGDNGTELVEVARQGAPGPSGEAGPAGPSAEQLTLPATTAIGGQRAVRFLNGHLAYASSLNVGDANLVLGISVNAASPGGEVVVQTSGLMTDGYWTWTPDAPIFCGVQGVLTQVLPTTGFILILGVALSATRILVGAKMPLIIVSN